MLAEVEAAAAKARAAADEEAKKLRLEMQRDGAANEATEIQNERDALVAEKAAMKIMQAAMRMAHIFQTEQQDYARRRRPHVLDVAADPYRGPRHVLRTPCSPAASSSPLMSRVRTASTATERTFDTSATTFATRGELRSDLTEGQSKELAVEHADVLRLAIPHDAHLCTGVDRAGTSTAYVSLRHQRGDTDGSGTGAHARAQVLEHQHVFPHRVFRRYAVYHHRPHGPLLAGVSSSGASGGCGRWFDRVSQRRRLHGDQQ